GSGGGGGGSAYFPTDFSKPITMTLNLIKGQTYNLNINSEVHTYSITQIDIENQNVEFVFESERKVLLLNLNKTELLNYNDDNYYDFEITLTKIYGKEVVEIRIKSVHLLIPFEVSQIVEEPIIEISEISVEEEPEVIVTVIAPKEVVREKPKSNTLIWLLGFVLFLLLIVIWYGIYDYYKSKKKQLKEKEDEDEEREKIGGKRK
ncbi:MAG: hypothetical protein AABY22_35655, partial [Nanoarchaeota archaeon]